MQLLRVWLPAGIALVGVALVAVGHGSYSSAVTVHSLESATGVALVIVAAIVWMVNWLYRLSVGSSADRDREERAREYFERTGRWPDEEEPGSRNGAS